MIAVTLFISILVWFLALQIWNPATLTRSLFSLSGMLRFIGGAIVAFLALALLYVGLHDSTYRVISILALATFLTALTVEYLIGDDLRRMLTR